MAVLVDLKLQPCPACGNKLDMVYVGPSVYLVGEIDARRSNELRYDDTLRAVNDKRAAIGHEWEVAHKDELLFDFPALLVDKAHIDKQWRLIGDVFRAALIH